MPPVWVYVAAALVIALLAFGIGQLVPGLGLAFVLLVTALWTAFAANRGRKSDGT